MTTVLSHHKTQLLNGKTIQVLANPLSFAQRMCGHTAFDHEIKQNAIPTLKELQLDELLLPVNDYEYKGVEANDPQLLAYKKIANSQTFAPVAAEVAKQFQKINTKINLRQKDFKKQILDLAPVVQQLANGIERLTNKDFKDTSL